MNKLSLKELLNLRNKRFIKNGIIVDVKFENDSDNGWIAVGNDWTNYLRDLIFKTSYYELISDGWKPTK